jgi:PAS domain S-box-containing protein
MQDRIELTEALREAALAVSTAQGERVFEELVAALARILRVEYALISVYVEPQRTHLRTLATFFAGRPAKNVEYPAAGTPCEKAIGRAFGFHPKGVARLFPDDRILADHRIEGYAATTLHDVHGAPIGALAVMSRRELTDPGVVEAMLKIFAARVAAEIERRRSEASYRAIFESAETCIFIYDFRSGAIVDANPKACATYGYSVEELRRLPLEQRSSGERPYTSEDAAPFLERARQGEIVRFEWRRRNKDGSLHWDDVMLKRVEIDGRPHIMSATREITERKAAEEQLRASEEQYRAIFNATAESLLLRDAQFRVVDVNPAYEALSGRRRDEVLGSERLTVQVPTLNDERRELHRRALAGETLHFESEAERKDGSRFRIEIHAVPMTYRGEPHVLYIGRDITERKAAEEQLRASEEQYRAVFNATADSLVLRDAEFRIVDVNPAYESMSGRKRAEVIGGHRVTMSDPQLHARIRALHDVALRGEPVQWEARAERSDGETFDLEVRGVPIQYQGRPHVLYIGRDITARKRAEAGRLALEGQLRQAQKMEAIGQLSGGIAHDFNNILQSVLGNLVLASERQAEIADDRLGRYLERAQASSLRARDLIRQMLTFSRGQRGDRRALALPGLVQEATGLLRSTLPSTIELRVKSEGRFPEVLADRIQIEQVLLNLCINARDAINGAGRIGVGLRLNEHRGAVCASCRQRVSGRFVELRVRDSGPGIAAPVLERMFDPFFSTKEIGKGSGMGLSMVHGIVHEHGGHVLVDPGWTRGALFRVLLPALDVPGAQEHARGAVAAVTPVRPGLRGRVLLADDEPMIRELLCDLLEGWGLEVEAHADGAAARDAFAEDPHAFNLVLTDQTMPKLTGLQLSGLVQGMRPGMPVILCTGYGEELRPAELEAAGVKTLARKPVEPETLRALVEANLAGR